MDRSAFSHRETKNTLTDTLTSPVFFFSFFFLKKRKKSKWPINAYQQHKWRKEWQNSHVYKTLETVHESWQSQYTTTFTKSAWDCIQTLTDRNTDWVGSPHFHYFRSCAFQLEPKRCFQSEAMIQGEKKKSIHSVLMQEALSYINYQLIYQRWNSDTRQTIWWHVRSFRTDAPIWPNQITLEDTQFCVVSKWTHLKILQILPSSPHIHPPPASPLSLSTLESLWWPRNV